MRKTTAGPDAGDGRRFISGPLSIFGGRRRMSMGQYEPRDVLPPPEAELPDDYPGIGKRPLLARHYQEADHLIRALPAEQVFHLRQSWRSILSDIREAISRTETVLNRKCNEARLAGLDRADDLARASATRSSMAPFGSGQAQGPPDDDPPDDCPGCARPMPGLGVERCPDCGEALGFGARISDAGEEKT